MDEHPRILIVESDEKSADVLKHELEMHHYRVELLPDGVIALSQFEHMNDLPDLILLRAELPRMNGYTVCNKLKRKFRLRQIPLILLSSQATTEKFSQHRRLRTRADAYMHIPYDMEALMQLIREHTLGDGIVPTKTVQRRAPSPAKDVRSPINLTPKKGQEDIFSTVTRKKRSPIHPPARDLKRSGILGKPDAPRGAGTIPELKGMKDEEEIIDLGAEALVYDEDTANLKGGRKKGSKEATANHIRSLWGKAYQGKTIDPDETLVVPKTPDSETSDDLEATVERSARSKSALSNPPTEATVQRKVDKSLLREPKKTPVPQDFQDEITASNVVSPGPEGFDDDDDDDDVTIMGKPAAILLTNKKTPHPGLQPSNRKAEALPALNDDTVMRPAVTSPPPKSSPFASVSSSSVPYDPRSLTDEDVHPGSSQELSQLSKEQLEQVMYAAVEEVKTSEIEEKQNVASTMGYSEPMKKVGAKKPRKASPFQKYTDLGKPKALELVDKGKTDELQAMGAPIALPPTGWKTPTQMRRNAPKPNPIGQTISDPKLPELLRAAQEKAEAERAGKATPPPLPPKKPKAPKKPALEIHKTIEEQWQLETENKLLEKQVELLRKQKADAEKQSEELRKELEATRQNGKGQSQKAHSERKTDTQPDLEGLQKQLRIREEEALILTHRLDEQKAAFERERAGWDSDESFGSTQDKGLQRKWSEAQAQLDIYKEEKKELYEKITSLQQEVSQQKKKLKFLDRTKEKYSRSEEILDANEAALSTKEQLLQDQLLRMDLLQEEYEHLKREHVQLQTTVRHRERDILEQEELLQQTHSRLRERELEVQKLHGELASSRSFQRLYNADDSSLLQKVADQEKELQLLREDVKNQKEDSERLQGRFDKQAKKLVELKKYQETTELSNVDASSRFQQSEKKFRKLREEHKRLDTNFKRLQDEHKHLSKEHTELSDEVSFVADERNRYRDEVVTIGNELDALRTENRNLQDSENTLRRKLQKVQRERDSFHDKLQGSTFKLNNLGRGVEDLEEELIMLRQQNVRYEQEVFDFKDKERYLEERSLEAQKRYGEENKLRLEYQDRSEAYLKELEKVQKTQQEFKKKLEEQKQAFNDERQQKELFESEKKRLFESLQEKQEQLKEEREAHQEKVSQFEDQMSSYEQQLKLESEQYEALLSQKLSETEQQWQQKADGLQETLLEEHQRAILEEQAGAKQREQELRKEQQEFLEGTMEQLKMAHETEMQQLWENFEQERSQQEQQHLDKVEEVQKQLEEHHELLLSQSEAESLELREQLAKIERQHRQEALEKEASVRQQTEEQIKKLQEQATLHEQMVEERFANRERELQEELEQARELLEQYLGADQELEQKLAELEEERELLLGRLNDVEALRRHERNEIEKLKNAQTEEMELLQEEILTLEHTLQEDLMFKKQMKERVRGYEDQRVMLQQSLQEALSLLSEEPTPPKETYTSRAVKKKKKLRSSPPFEESAPRGSDKKHLSGLDIIAKINS